MSPTTKELIGWGIILSAVGLVIFAIASDLPGAGIGRAIVMALVGSGFGIRMLRNARASEQPDDEVKE